MAPNPRPNRPRRYRASAVRFELEDGELGRLRDFNERGIAFETTRALAVGDAARGVLARGASRVAVEGTVCWVVRLPPSAKPDSPALYRVGLEFPDELVRQVRQGLTVLLAGTGFWRPE